MRCTHVLPLLVVTIAALSSACADAVGCDFREGGVSGPEDRCQERRSFQANGFDVVCEGLGGAAVAGGCPTEGIVAGCALDGDITDWFYPPKTREEVEGDCDDTFVEAP